MALRNRQPNEPRRADRPIRKLTSTFKGMITGEPSSELPDYYSQWNYNIIDRGEYCQVRSGSKIYTSSAQGFQFVGIPATDEFQTTRKHPWLTGDIIYLKGDNLPVPLLEDTAYWVIKSTDYKIQIATSYANAIAGTAKTFTGAGVGTQWILYGAVNAFCDHVKSGKIIWMLGQTVYVSDKAVSSYEKVLNLNGTNSSGESMAIPYGEDVLLASNTGLFKIVLNDDFYYMYRINLDAPIVPIAGIAENVGSGVIYGYLGIYSVARISGDDNRDRITDEAVLEQESATNWVGGVEIDYGEYYFDTEIGVDLAEYHVIGPFTVPDGVNEATHFTYYRSKNIGTHSGGVSADASGLGNRRDQFEWDADIPVAKSFVLDTSSTGGSAKVVSGNKFVLGDVGSVLKDLAGLTSTITGWVSEDEVTIGAGITVATVVNAAIGGGRVLKASQSGTTVTFSGTGILAADLGKMLFVSDGTRRHISKYTDTTHVEVADGADFTDLTVTIRPVSGNFSRNWNDTVPDQPQADGRVSWIDRAEYGTDFYVPRRLFRAMPNCNIIFSDNGFLIVAQRDASEYYYCQTGDKPYTIGQYKFPEQKRAVSGSIRAVFGFPYKAVFFFKTKTGVLVLNNAQNIGRTEIGENIYQLPELSIVDDVRGVVAWTTIIFKNSGLIFALTNESAYRYFDGTAWSKENFAYAGSLDAVFREYLKSIDHNEGVTANYNSIGGAKIWMRKWKNATGAGGATYLEVQDCDDDTVDNLWQDCDEPYLVRGSGVHDQQDFSV